MSDPSTKRGRLQRACLELLQQHEADGAIPTNGRFIFYELEQAGVIPKAYVDEHGRKLARQPAADISRALMDLRQLGLQGAPIPAPRISRSRSSRAMASD